MIQVICLLIKRFLQGAAQEKSLSVMIKICFVSIVIGSFSLALVAAVMNGFEQSTRQKLQGINADLLIRSFQKPIAYEKVRAVVLQEYAPFVTQLTPQLFGHALLHVDSDKDISSVFMIIAIDPSTEEQVSSLAHVIIEKLHSQDTFTDLFKDNQVLIGQAGAQQYGLQVGNMVDLLYVPQGTQPSTKITLEQMLVKISGIFKSGIDEFDTHVVICSRQFFAQLFPDQGINQIGVKLTSSKYEKQMIEMLSKRLNLAVISWKDLYPALLSALTLEKYAMIFILMLFTLVASMNIIALLFMYLTHKRRDIALFKAMGMSNKVLRCVFMVLGMLIACGATIIGVSGAALVSWLLDTYQLIPLPDVYYVAHLPAHMNGTIIFFVLCIVLLMTFGATWFATRRMQTYSIVRILKFEQ
ncbi:MAG: FtsX-like permease family protein [Candidatus Babeliaceae bacterium]